MNPPAPVSSTFRKCPIPLRPAEPPARRGPLLNSTAAGDQIECARITAEKTRNWARANWKTLGKLVQERE